MVGKLPINSTDSESYWVGNPLFRTTVVHNKPIYRFAGKIVTKIAAVDRVDTVITQSQYRRYWGICQENQQDSEKNYLTHANLRLYYGQREIKIPIHGPTHPALKINS